MLGRCTEYKSTSPLHELLFYVGQDPPLKLPYGHIARKSTSPFHELLFCVEQDSPLKLPYGHISYKGTSPLHEQFFCADWDYSLTLPCDHILYIFPIYFYVLHLDVVLISFLWVFVSHKCCNSASRVHLLSFDKYSCFPLSLRDSVPFLRNPSSELMLILNEYRNSSDKLLQLFKKVKVW